jgi:hypothetical protein
MNDNTELINTLINKMMQFNEEARLYRRRDRKLKRPALKLAKEGQRALRRILISIAGSVNRNNYPYEEVVRVAKEYSDSYIARCALLYVSPPAVKVPRWLQPGLGKTIGGFKNRYSWDADWNEYQTPFPIVEAWQQAKQIAGPK